MKARKKLSTFFLVFIPITLVIAAVVLRFGLNVNGLLEEYLVMGIYAFPERLSSDIFTTDTQSALRPFALPTAMLIYGITPYSYFGVNIINYSLIIIKGVVLFYILERLRFSRSIALAIAILFAIYPTNSMGLRLMTIIQLVTVTFLFAVLFYLRLHTKWRWFDAIAMLGCLTLATTIYEMAYPLIFVTPILPLLLYKKISKRFISLSFLWYAVPTIVAIRWLYFFIRFGDSHQSDKILDVDNNPLTLIVKIAEAIQHNIVDIWYSSFVAIYNSGLFYFVLVAGIALLLLIFLTRLNQGESQETRKQLLIQMLIALLVIVLGYAVFLVTNVRDLYPRVFGLSSIGSATFVICFVSWLTSYFGKYSTLIWRFTVVSLISLSLFSALVVREQQTLNAFEQQAIAAAIVEDVPASDARAVIIFSPGQHFVFERAIETPLQILYDKPDMNVYVCYLGYNTFFETNCQFNPEDVVLETISNDVTEIVRYSEIIAFEYFGDGNIQLLEEIPNAYTDDIILEDYAPFAIICQDCPYPNLVDTHFTSFPFEFPIQIQNEQRLRHLYYRITGYQPSD